MEEFVYTYETSGNLFLNKIPAKNITINGSCTIPDNNGILGSQTGIINLPDCTTTGVSFYSNANVYWTCFYAPKAAVKNNFLNSSYTKNNLVKTVTKGCPFQGNNSLKNSPNLKAVVIKNTSVQSLNYVAAVTASGIGQNEDGYIYVPRDLVNSYKIASNWSTFESKFRAIEDYPLVDAPDTYLPS